MVERTLGKGKVTSSILVAGFQNPWEAVTASVFRCLIVNQFLVKASSSSCLRYYGTVTNRVRGNCWCMETYRDQLLLNVHCEVLIHVRLGALE